MDHGYDTLIHFFYLGVVLIFDGGSDGILKEVLSQVKTGGSSADYADYADFFTTTKY
jgi:hypothetical protein